MTNANQLSLLLVVLAVLCGVSYGFSEVLEPINAIAKALVSTKP